MATARKYLINDAEGGCFHLISRCVRRAFLCGDGAGAGKRRGHIAQMVQRASQCFAVEVLSFAVMDNHMHIVAKGQPARAMQWDDRTVAERWAALWPKRNPETRELEPWSEERIAMLAANSLHCVTLRKRLMSLSWFMRLIKEPIAKRANREDTCTGHFWEGRFKSVKLLDAAALVSCMAYVDLNPIRAKMADRPEDSDYTSIRARIQARQAHKKTLGLADIYGKTAALTPAIRIIILLGPGLAPV